MTKTVISPLFALFFSKKEDFVLFSLFIVLDIVFVLVYNEFDPPRYANIRQDCGSMQHGTSRRQQSWGLLTSTS